MHRTVEVWTEADIARVQFHRETPSFAITSGLKFLKLQLNSYLQLSYRDKDEIDICTIYVSWNGVRPDLILPTLGKESGITPTRPPVHYCHFIRCFKATDKKVILIRLLIIQRDRLSYKSSVKTLALLWTLHFIQRGGLFLNPFYYERSLLNCLNDLMYVGK